MFDVLKARVCQHFEVFQHEFANFSLPCEGRFTVVSLVTWPWIISEAGVDLVLIETSLLFICKSCHSYAN